MKPIYYFLLVFNSNNIPNLHILQVMAPLKISVMLYDLENMGQGKIQGHQNEANM